MLMLLTLLSRTLRAIERGKGRGAAARNMQHERTMLQPRPAT
jgi:hypothetical protein